MKKMRFTWVTWVAVLIIAVGCSSSNDTDHLKDFAFIEKHFADPTPEFRPASFWIWHDVVTREKIREQLQDFKEKGIGGVFVHPRYGLVTEYLSEDWFDLFEYTIEVADELDMNVWIYDENSFPSGFAGGHVPAVMPESYIQGQGLELVSQKIFQPEPEKRYLHYLKADDNGNYSPVEDIAVENGKSGDYILLELVNYPTGKWYGGFSYVDLIYPGVTDTFINVTMKGYERFASRFGNRVAGVFTDEPNIAPPGGKNCIRWTPDFPERFQEHWGYRIEDHILSLYTETGDWKRVRHNYYQLLLQLFIDRWSKPWHEYTTAKDLVWTGHYWEHGWPSPHHGGDNMAMYAWHQMPGIDLLFNTIDQEEYPVQFGNPRLVKELKSVANQMGRDRTLSETYGASGWELTLEDQKRLGDWAYALGLNFMNPHLAYMTLLGDRKHDFPQSFSYHAPYWESYRKFTDYFARLSLVLSAAKQFNDVLVIEPTSTTWMYYSSHKPNAALDSIGHSFQDFLDKLEAYQIEYDLGSENIIKDHGSVRDGKFVVNQRAYKLVVLPFGMENLDRETFTLLSSYLEQGGRVISLGDYPTWVDGQVDNELATTIEQYKENWLLASQFTDNHVFIHFLSDEVRFQPENHIPRALYHYRGKLADGHVIFLVNTHMGHNAKGSFTIQGKQVALLDAESGSIRSYPFQVDGEGIEVNFDILPATSLLLFVSDTEMKALDEFPVPNKKLTPLEATTTVKPAKDNVLVLDYCTLRLPGQNESSLLYFYQAGEKIWKHHGFPDNPWVSSSQFKTELVDRDTFGTGTGYELVFPFQIAKGVDKSSLRAVAERPGLFKVSINGKELIPLAGEWYLERDFGVYAIGDALNDGQNFMTIKVEPMSMFAEVAPVFITGNFSLASRLSGWEIVPYKDMELGAWTKQGLPFYSAGVIYQKQVELEKVPLTARVQLNHWKGSVAEVHVNGVKVGAIAWLPNELDIAPYLMVGSNLVEIVVQGTLKNLLGPHHLVRRRGIVTPWSFKYAPEVQPAGEQYDVLEYGLMRDFDVMVGY